MNNLDDHPPTIDGFHIYDKVGEGGYSRVYRALQLSVEREVAVKVLNRGFTDHVEREAFLQECKVMGRLEHPHVVRVYDSATTADGRGCIVMQLYSDTYRDRNRLSVPELVDIGVKISGALAAAHQRDIVHHDVKPQNLFRSADGEPALGDFGISSVAGQRAGGTRLTIKYAPPEMLRDNVSDARGDIWALGVTLYQLATANLPFEGATDDATIKAIFTQPPPPLRRSDAPPELERLIQRCLARNPDDRPRTAAELADEFRVLQQRVGLPLTTPVQTRRRPEPTIDGGHTADAAELGREQYRAAPIPEAPAPTDAEPAATPRRWWPPVAIGSLIIVVAVLAVWVSSRGGTSAEQGPTTTSPVTTTPFVVVVPPIDLAVSRVNNHITFTWSPNGDVTAIEIRNTTTGDQMIAQRSPFTWSLPTGGATPCFEARGYLDGKLSADRTPPVCLASSDTEPAPVSSG